MRGDVFLGDLIAALHALGVRDATRASALARMLGIESLPDVREPAEPPLAPGRDEESPPPSKARLPIERSGAPRQLESTASRDAAHGVVVEAMPAAGAPAAPVWLPAIGMARTVPAAMSAGLRIDPLFEPPRQRALLAALVAAPVDDGEVDLDVLVEMLARRQLPGELPRRCVWSLRRGVQLLLDRGATMVPFDRDVDALLRRLHGLLPADRIACLHFVGNPLRGCRRPGEPAKVAWTPPPRGTPVLLVSDLGIGGSAQRIGRTTPSMWREFAAFAADAGVLLRTLVPYAPGRWPAGLGVRLRALHWDRRTTAALVRRLLGG